MPGPALPKDELARLSAMWLAGLPVKVIARDIGRDWQRLKAAIDNHARRRGRALFPPRRLPGGVQAPDGSVFASQAEAAVQCGRNHTWVWRRLRDPESGWLRLGPDGRPLPPPPPKGVRGSPKRTRAPDGRVFESQRAAARAYGVAESTVSDWLRDPRSGWRLAGPA